MPKKTANSRSGSRSRARQKGFEVVRSGGVGQKEVVEESEEEEIVEEVEVVEEEETRPARSQSGTNAAGAAVASTQPRSAAARMAARRQAQIKTQRPTTSMILAENYSYVRKDLIFILILAFIMFTAIVILKFVPAIGG
jgi:hypothetical protein